MFYNYSKMNLIQMMLLSLLFIAINSLDSRSMLLRQNWSMVITSCGTHKPSFLNKQFNVSVPSTLHLNLEKHKQIVNPYFGSHLKDLTFLSDCSVKFTKNFQLGGEFIRQFSKTVLRFEGIDTYSTVTFNGIKLGITQNAFLQYQFDVKPHLKMGNNQLVVEIKSSKPIDAERQKNDRMPFDYAQTRKACYQYSWDWAPYMNTVGIWLPVSLVFYNLAKFEYVWIRNQELTEQKAILDFTLALGGIDQQTVKANNIEVRLVSKNTKEDLRFKLVSRYSSFKLTVNNPRLWWPNNIGDPYLYQFELSLMQKGFVLDHKKMLYGIRTVRLNSEGTNFQIIVNGYPIYCKGANYVPPDMMYPRLINPDFTPANTIENLLNDAVQSNFNMIRVWGGGQYQTDQFYEMASKKGIMIFHDFMFSDSVYPGSDQFLQNVRKEVIYQVRRLRNYPAIVLWSGNNEILQGIQSWGWGQPRYRESYRKLFGQLIPDILNVECNYLPYIQSSPSKGVGNAGFGQGGDIHYWGVWAASAPFENYDSALGGFNSEFGTQALPVWQTISDFTTTNDRMYQSEQLAFHEKHVSRFNTLRSYIARYSKPSTSFELQAFLSGLVQAYGLEIAIRAQRCAKPKSFGTLYWQFNDAWPSISWSSIDYYGRWKPLQYLAKQYFKDIILFFHPSSGKFVAINDKLIEIKAQYKIQVMRFDGLVVYEDSGLLSLKENEKRQIGALDTAYFAGKENNTLVYTEIIYGQHEDNITALTTYFRSFKDLNLEPATVSVKYIYESNQIEFTSMQLVKNLYVSSSQYYLKLSENYFDVLPGRPKKIKIIKPTSLGELQSSLRFKSYRQIIDNTQGLGIRLTN